MLDGFFEEYVPEGSAKPIRYTVRDVFIVK